jgi:hypothetical protein
MMLGDRWAAASAYALSFVDYRDCSHEADELNYCILLLRVLAALAAGQARSVEPLSSSGASTLASTSSQSTTTYVGSYSPCPSARASTTIQCPHQPLDPII